MKIILMLALFQVNPPFIPVWMGREPIQYCISGEMEPYREQVTFAFFAWASRTGLYARETHDCSAPRTVAYRMQPLDTFMGIGMYPPPLIVQPWAGDVWLDTRRDWGGRDLPLLIPTLLHETGHAWGMGHSWRPESVMNPNPRPGVIALAAEDRRLIGCLYLGECQVMQ